MTGGSLRRVAERLGSIHTALVLFAALVVLSAAGTLLAPVLERAAAASRRLAFLVGLSDTFRSPPFIVAGALLAANVGVCTWNRTLRRRRKAGATRPSVRWLDAGTHLALVVMILGLVGKALFEEVGTGYLLPQVPVTAMQDPLTGTDLPLGFEVVMRERRTEYYPLSLKIGVREAASSVKLGLLELDEGVPSGLAGTDLSVELRGATADGREALLEVRTGGTARTLRFALKDGSTETDRAGRFQLTLVAYARQVRTVRGRIEIREGGRTVREDWLEVNGGVVHRGVRISIIAWSTERSDEEFLGVQCRRDHAAPVFWTGTTALSVLLPFFLLARRRGGSRSRGERGRGEDAP